MKLKQFLQPADSYFSTPKAARRLLRLFSQVLVVGMIAGAVVTLGSAFSNELSRRQGYMNDAISNARVFFTQREVLLRCLAFSALERLRETGAPGASGENLADKAWTFQLSDLARQYLKANRINLLHVSNDPAFPAFYLNNDATPIATVSQDIIQRLQRLAQQTPAVNREIWMSDQSSSPPRIYVFTLTDGSRAQSGWIGMEMDASDVTNTLHDDTAGQFMMLNASGEVMMSSAGGESSTPPLLRWMTGENLGFSGSGILPDSLVMRKQLGFSNWQIYYSIELRSLIDVFWWPLAICLAVIVLITVLVNRLVSRIERRLITPATQRIDALIESEAFSRAVIQTAPVALCVLRRADGQVVLENRLSEQWLGECSERERLCHGWIEQAFDQHESNQSDEFQAGNGRHLYLSFVPTRYNGEDVLFCAFSDISSRKQVEAALAMAKHMADAANEAKTLFLATMSHEIRTPLYGVLGTLELLGKTDLKTQQKSYLHAIENSSTALLNLVCDVLDVAKIEAGQLALEIHDFSPVDLVYSVVQSYMGAARGKGLVLYSYIDPCLPAVLRGDVTRIRQILNNLLNNAVKFTDSGQVVLRVKAGAVSEDCVEVYWQVSDTGPGITHADQVFLFEPFYQTGSATNVVAGTGLGLSICQRLALLMNGSIRVVSASGLGSSFTLDVALGRGATPTESSPKRMFFQAPVYVCSPVLEMAEYIEGWLHTAGARVQIGKPPVSGAVPAAVLIEIHPGAQRSLVPDWQGARILVSPESCQREGQSFNQWDVELNDLNGLFDALIQAQGGFYHPPGLLDAEVSEKLSIKVLVVEDNLINQLILKDQLQELGCQVVLASEASEALLLWNASEFDVVLTDINMPGMNGYELTRKLRSLGCTAPIIGATANAMRDERDRCLDAGMQQLLVKPFGLGALFNCLQQYERVDIDGL